ncbi:uncharacterized protein F5147DRAFT_688234 [Suillus discolor]|uniref:Uncharacterized protein n=1 Tax=Suillus discolor TaxID=1912936 RepID=A0A9P7FBM9_9AGAM|nr:uncharacterized protein F5147DRAFT_688234 [Suillus discolor]KAG2110985.1 hypothetical protein F5147DRAFT_688234 [Suillus discolor]
MSRMTLALATGPQLPGATLAKTVVRSTVTPKGSDTESLCFSIADSIDIDYGNSSKPACLHQVSLELVILITH